MGLKIVLISNAFFFMEFIVALALGWSDGGIK